MLFLVFFSPVQQRKRKNRAKALPENEKNKVERYANECDKLPSSKCKRKILCCEIENRILHGMWGGLRCACKTRNWI